MANRTGDALALAGLILGAVALALVWGQVSPAARMGSLLAIAGAALAAVPTFRRHAITNFADRPWR